MFLKMKISQKTGIGHLRAGGIYELNPDNSAHKKVLDRLIKNEFADKITADKMKKMKAEAKKIASEDLVDTSDLDKAVQQLQDKVSGLDKSLDAIATAAGVLSKARVACLEVGKLAEKEKDDEKRLVLDAQLQEQHIVVDDLVTALIEVAHK